MEEEKKSPLEMTAREKLDWLRANAPEMFVQDFEETLYQIGLAKYNQAKKLVTDCFGEDEGDDDGDGGIEKKTPALV